MAIIKSYIANSQKEAFDKVKDNLGDEAVIISTRKIRKKGFLNILKKPAVEITAVIDEVRDCFDKRTNTDNNEPLRTPYNEQKNNEKLERLETQMMQISEMVGMVNQNIDYIKQKKLLEESPDSQELFKLLKDCDISEETIERLICEVVECSSSKDETPEDSIKRVIANKIGDVSPISLNKEGRRVVFLVGPTGVGKTTTLAKIAAAFALQQNARVGIITEDTYRIGAVEQLRIYADILGVPLYVVYSPEELLQKIESMGDMNLILVDTAGKNTNDKDYHKNIQKMIKSPDDAEVHLVFSATTGLNNAVGILKSYSFLEDYKLIFTKLDEVEKFGMILEIKMRTDKPLSYITHGQNVASDISEADAIEITNKILGCEVRVN